MHNAPDMSIVHPDDESKAERKRKKELERFTETRVLDPWERYRALADHVDHLLDVTELADRKKRIYDQDLIALLQTAAPANERMAAPAWGRASSAA